MGYSNRAVSLSTTLNNLDIKAHVPLKEAAHLAIISGLMGGFLCVVQLVPLKLVYQTVLVYPITKHVKTLEKKYKTVKNDQILITLDLPKLIIFYFKQSIILLAF